MNTEQSQKTLADSRENRDIVSVKVRLFGTARSAAGVTVILIDAPSDSSDRQLASLIRQSIPELVGPVIDLESGELKTSHTFNLNGVNFIDGDVELRDGDEILLFSSQAGG
jgi:molybdopterin converting factor small subunit